MVEVFVSLGTVILLLDNSLGKCFLKKISCSKIMPTTGKWDFMRL